MSDSNNNSTVLIHRVKTVMESARAVRVEKNWRGKYVLNEKIGEKEELLFIRVDGRIRPIVDAKSIDLSSSEKEQGGKFVVVPKGDSPLDIRGQGGLADGEKLYRLPPEGFFQSVLDTDDLPFEEGIRVFAVQEDPFDLEFMINLGQEKDGFHWTLQLGGDAKITNPEAFLGRYYAKAKDAPFTVQGFLDALGTRPSNLLLDEILHKSMAVLSLDDLNVDVAQWAKERNLTEDAFTAAIAAKSGTPFGTGVVKFTVNSVRFASQDRDEIIKSREQEEEDKRKLKEEEEKKRKDEEEKKRKDREDAEEKRQEQLAQKEYEVKMATLDQKIAALKGPRPEIWMDAPIYVQGNRVQTRDCVCVTSSDYGNAAEGRPSNRPKNTISVGDLLEFNLRANIDGWLHLYNYGTSGKVSPLFTNRHIFANETYSIRRGGNLYDGWLFVNDKTRTTRESGRLERFIAIITREKIQLDENSVKAVFDKRNPGTGFATRGAFDSVEEVPHAEEEVLLEEAMASLVDLPPEDWVQGTLELEVV